MSFVQSILGAAGPGAGAIEWVWWVFLWICTAVFVVVLCATIAAALHGRRPASVDVAADRRVERVIAGAGIVTVVLLFVLLGADIATGRRLQAEPRPEVHVNVTGQQWWWTVEYQSDVASNIVRTANELHVPVGRPVLVTLRSTDVIHSFWIPALQGKRDLIPGHVTSLRIQADHEGVFRGQCAEFCGHQHAHMAFYVVAESPADFARWMSAQRKPASDPADALAVRGRDVFLSGPCVMCHTVRGTQAGSRLGPDLTHVASRLSLAAGTLPNTTGHLAAWIANAQGIKPGSRMPALSLPPDDLQALVAYLRTLR